MENTGLNSLKPTQTFAGDVKIIKKSKPGPVVFIVTNGIGAIEAVIKDSDFEAGQVVYIEGTVNEHRGRLQIELEKITNSDMDFETIINERAKPVRTEFSIQSDRYQKMKPRIMEIATRIRRAILEGQPIMIRHHNDADGIISGTSIEHACTGLMEQLGIDTRYMLFRSPSRAPFYAVNDVLRDIVLSKRFVENDSNLKPLIIVADNGSTPEDVLGLNSLKTLGYEVIVIDHHNPIVIDENGNTAIEDYVLLHLNPYKFGLDSKTSAGMLCYEIARFVNENFENKKMPAVAGIADRCDIEETDSYISATGETRENLGKIGTAIDYISYQLKHDSGKGVYEELFENTDFVNLLNEAIKKGADTQLQSTLPYLRTFNINEIIFSTIDLEKYTMRFTFPAPGGVLSRIHEITASQYETNPVLTIGYLSDMIIVRATHPVLPVQNIIDNLQAKFPSANVDGGGHEMAGAIRFVNAHRDEILEEVKEMVKGLELPQVEEEN